MGCGVFGAINFDNQPVFPYIYWGMRAQNNRGHQSHGFLTRMNDKFHIHRALDLIPKLKQSAIQEWFARLPGNVGIANVRYTTSGRCDERSLIKGTQPVTAGKNGQRLAVTFNGNVINTRDLYKEIGCQFRNFSYECDGDLICHKLLMELLETRNLTDAVKQCMSQIEGSYSVIGVTKNGEFFAFKDPHGIRPISAGHGLDDKTFAFSSETVGFDINGFERDFELEPGELVTVSEKGFERVQLTAGYRRAFCSFEYAYFARPDSTFDSKYVYEVREQFGRNIVQENPEIIKNADIILSIPETGDDSAIGVHDQSGLRWERAARRHRYVTERAFILLNRERHATIDRKINILASKVKGKRVIVTEDSIVRGDTTRITIEKLRRMGAKKVYVFVTFPRIIGPCFYGIDMATYSQLIGSRQSTKQIAEAIGADDICYQSIDGMAKAIGFARHELCTACITGEYPTPLAQTLADEARQKFMNGEEEQGRPYDVVEPFEKACSKTS